MPFWVQEDRVKFSCTGCGRCCQNDGEVWFNLEEFTELAMSLNMPAETAMELYVDEVKSDWVKMKNKVVATPSNSWIPNLIQDSDQCIFLGSDGKACSIYDQRPIQCRTYPYWPRLLKDVKEWKKEIVVPENKPGNHWNPKDGGCEGIDHENATSIPSKKIFINKQLFELYHQAFPILQTPHDKERLILKFDVMKNIILSTKEWVKQFVIKYNLCPFAQRVFDNHRVRYRVYLVHEKAAVIEKLKLEVLYLLSHPEEEVETTLIMFPFAFKNFKDFYDFSLDLEDEILPAYLDSIDNFAEKYFSEDKSKKKSTKRLFRKIDTTVKEKERDLQLACFHPQFEWADCPDFNDPLNFEKRAPFPTINILRSKRIRELASELKTRKIANHNSNILTSIGGQKLAEEFEKCLQIANS
eukprot:gene11595-12647_t